MDDEKRTEAQLAAELADLRRHTEVLNAFPMPAMLIDTRCVVVDVNGTFMDVAQELGSDISREDRIGQHICQFAGEGEERDRLEEAIDEVLGTGEAARPREWWHAKPSGEMSRWRLSVNPLRDAAGQLVGAVVLREEITERQRSGDALKREYELRDAESLIRFAIASMDRPEHLCRVVKEIGNQLHRTGVDHDTCTIQIVNPEGTDFVSFASYIHEEWYDEIMKFVATGSRDADRSHADEYPWVIGVWRSGEPRYVGCTEIGGRGATFRNLSLIDVPFSRGTLAINKSQPHAFGEEDIGVLQRFAGVLSAGFQRFVDIAERIRAQDELRASQERIRTLVTEGHQRARNSLQTIWGLLDLQARHTDDEKVLAALRDGGSRVRAVSLAYEKLCQCRDPTEVDLAAYLRVLAEDLVRSHRMGDFSIELELALEEMTLGPDETITCGLIVNELVMKALRRTPDAGPKGVVGVCLQMDGDSRVRLAVWDGGKDDPSDEGQALLDSVVEKLDGEIAVERQDGTRVEVVWERRRSREGH